jgi:hypothetical protein
VLKLNCIFHLSLFEDKIPEQAQIQLYRPQSMLVLGLENRQQSYLQRLQKSDAKQDYRQWLAQNQKQPEDILVAPFNGRYGWIWLLFDKEGKYVDYI